MSWNSSGTNASGYRLYRHTVNDSNAAVVLRDSLLVNYATDTSVVPSQVYYYWVKAYRTEGTSRVYSAFSAVETGYAHAMPQPPATLQATDGLYTNRVVISWSAASNAIGYDVYRSTASNSASASTIRSSLYATSWTDTTATAGTMYYYWIKSFDFDAAGSQYVYSAFSAMDAGYANRAPVASLIVTPTNGAAPLRAMLDCSGSYDPNGSLVLVEIDRDGNGVYETSLSSVGQLIVEYASPGTFLPSVRVTDDNGLQATATCSVTVWGEGPHAVLDASPVSGTAPLPVTLVGTNSTASSGRAITVYEWDVDGDGSYDHVTTNSQYAWTYGAAGAYTAVLRITDSAGMQDTDSKVITVSPAADPPVVTLSASTNNGSIPLTVTFNASVSGGGVLAAYKWDFDGDGAYDISTSNNALTHTYTGAGVYPASVTVLDAAGLSDSDSVTITAVVAEVLRVWISTPKEGATLWGEKVSLHANTAPGSLTQAVRFEYKRADESEWTVAGGYLYTPARSFATNWDVTGLSDGSNYNLRARALDLNTNEVVSEVVTVRIDSGGSTNIGAIVESVVGGMAQKEQTFSKDETTFVGVSDGTEVIVPAGAVDSNTTVRVILTGLNTNAPSGSAAGKAAIDANRHVSLGGDPTLTKPIVITIPYNDVDNDGIVDGTGVPEMTLTAHFYDTVAGLWRRALSTEVHPDENYLKATTYHLTEFGLFGSKNLLHPANGSVLEMYTSESSSTNGIANLTDDNTISFWQSKANPAEPQEMVYTFKDDQTALISGAGIYNHGDGSTGYSRSFQILGSINGTTYTVLTNGELAATADAQIFNFGSVTCRTVMLMISNGVATESWELAEFELYGDLTPDADNDTLTDAWEVRYFDDLSGSATNDTDGDGLDNAGELRENTDPTVGDTDRDGMSDGDEVIAGTSATNENEVFSIANTSARGAMVGNLLGNPGFETGWAPANSMPYWNWTNPPGTHAGIWGDAGVTNVNPHEGTNVATLAFQSGIEKTGGWWQQVTNAYPAGTVWEASAWVRSDATYTNVRCELKIEFLDGAESTWVDTVFHYFSAPGETWTYVSGLATTPVGGVNVRIAVVAVDQGSQGALQIDDCSLSPASSGYWDIRWPSATGRTYKVYATADLAQWTNLVYEAPGTGFEMTYTNRNAASSQGFMRVTVKRD